MQAIVLSDGKVHYTRTYPDPKPQAEEVLISPRIAGICATDLELTKGYMNFSGVLGHEFVGKVVKGPPSLQGKRVVADINLVCGKCELCQSGLSNHCQNRKTIGIDGHDGVFADFIALPQRNVHVIPETVTDEQAIFAEPLAAAFQVVQQVPIEARDKVIVLGDGRLGLLVVQVMANHATKGNVVLLGKHEDKITFAEKRGIQGILLKDMTFKPNWDIVVDCTGSAEGFAGACRLVRPRGKLILKSTWASGEPVDLSPLVINEVKLIGSRCGPIPTALNALAANQIETNGLITNRYPLEKGLEAMEKAAEPNQIKVVLEISS